MNKEKIEERLNNNLEPAYPQSKKAKKYLMTKKQYRDACKNTAEAKKKC